MFMELVGISAELLVLLFSFQSRRNISDISGGRKIEGGRFSFKFSLHDCGFLIGTLEKVVTLFPSSW